MKKNWVRSESDKKTDPFKGMSVGPNSRRVIVREETRVTEIQQRKAFKQDICDFAHSSDRFK
jgi:hypothetical protein